jgi:WD40 repeat protein
MSAVLDVARGAYFTVRGRTSPKRTMSGHNGGVCALAFFKDGRRAVIGSGDHTLRIWDVQKGVLIARPLEGHKGVRSVAVSPDNKLVASGGDNVLLWDAMSRHVRMFGQPEGHTDWVQSVCFSPNGKRLSSGSDDKTAVIWDVETGTVLATLKGHRSSVHSVAFSPDGLKLATRSSDRTIRVWRTDNAESILEIDDNYLVRSVVWSSDGQQLVSASDDRTVKFWDSSTGLQIGPPCIGHTHNVSSIAISTDGSFIATASNDKTVRLWSTKTHQQIGRALEHPDWDSSLAISPNGALLMSGGADGKVRLWSIENILKEHKVEERLDGDHEPERGRVPTDATTIVGFRLSSKIPFRI